MTLLVKNKLIFGKEGVAQELNSLCCVCFIDRMHAVVVKGFSVRR